MASSSFQPNQELLPETQNYLSNTLKIRGGPHGILMTLYFCQRPSSLTKQETIIQSAQFSDLPLVRVDHALVNECFSNWQPNIRTVENKQFVHRQKGGLHCFTLTAKGTAACEYLLTRRAQEIFASSPLVEEEHHYHQPDVQQAQAWLDQQKERKQRRCNKQSQAVKQESASPSLENPRPVVPVAKSKPEQSHNHDQKKKLVPSTPKRKRGLITSYFHVVSPSPKRFKANQKEA